MNIKKQLEQDASEHGAKGTNFFRFKEGESRVRILTKGTLLAQHFFGPGLKPAICYGENKGCPFHEGEKETRISLKYTLYLLDKEDNTIKMADIPYSVMRKISDFQEDSEYSFKEFPMSYDIKVIFKKEEAPANKYTVIAGRAIEPVSSAILKELEALLQANDPKDMIEKKKLKQIEDHKEQGIWQDPAIRAKNFREDVKKHNAKASKEPVVQLNEYPTEEINPEDIPF